MRANFTSPCGTTQAGLEALASGGFARVIGDAVLAATRRSRELSGGGGSGSGSDGSAGGAAPAKKS
ncbi:MAG: pyrroline-5-carboxylate reductase dimerization domain-containing protein [Alphaproteobacteria bacterium]